jgi:hypothetical protein
MPLVRRSRLHEAQASVHACEATNRQLAEDYRAVRQGLEAELDRVTNQDARNRRAIELASRELFVLLQPAEVENWAMIARKRRDAELSGRPTSGWPT